MTIEYSLEDIEEVSSRLLGNETISRIFCLGGEMGAGKTTLIETMCKNLGSEDVLSSPTFSIVNEYSLGEESIIHMDLFRIKSIDELLDAGLEDYFYSGNYVFIEWYSIAKHLIPKPYHLIEIQTIDPYRRRLKLRTIE